MSPSLGEGGENTGLRKTGEGTEGINFIEMGQRGGQDDTPWFGTAFVRSAPAQYNVQHTHCTGKQKGNRTGSDGEEERRRSQLAGEASGGTAQLEKIDFPFQSEIVLNQQMGARPGTGAPPSGVGMLPSANADSTPAPVSSNTC